MLRPGEWFGTVSLLLERGRRVTAVARTDVNLLRVPGDELRALLRRRPEWFTELGRDAIYNMDLAMQTAADLLIRDAAARCAAVLLRLAGAGSRVRMQTCRPKSRLREGSSRCSATSPGIRSVES
jgi:CRP-like cAMP-binding protein